ncbi:serine/arginine repetitive matrix protein 1 isoform X2 [Cherax quadricarinatus]
MLTRRQVIIEKPFRDRRYRDHRHKVRSAVPRIDAGPPREYPHLVVKLKKLRLERDRQGKICEDNIKLVHRMAIIMRTKRLDNINMAPRGPFEPRSRTSSRKPPVSSSREQDTWDQGESFLEQVTSEVERHIRPPPPGKLIQHRAPAGLCRVPHVGPPPSPRTSARRSHRVPIITLPLISPRSRRSLSPTAVSERSRGTPSPTTVSDRSRRSPSPTTVSERSSAKCRRGRETTRLSPLPGLPRRPSITASLPSPHDDNSSSAADDDGDFEEAAESYQSDDSQETEKQSEKSEDENKKTDGENVSSGEGGESKENSNNKKRGQVREGSGETDSDDRVSSILLSHHPNITIDEPSDDEFYT